MKSDDTIKQLQDQVHFLTKAVRQANIRIEALEANVADKQKVYIAPRELPRGVKRMRYDRGLEGAAIGAIIDMEAPEKD